MSTSSDASSAITVPAVGFVVIGRNEGDRLRRCIDSILEQSCSLNLDRNTVDALRRQGLPPCPIVYVDSGSTDGSVEFARNAGCHVVQLDVSTPFTAARARNSGMEKLLSDFPAIEVIQFVDGDCAIQPGWLKKASSFLSVNPHVGIVCGRRREVYPQRTIYNALCDMEWDTPVGDAKACGGDFVARRKAIIDVGGFNPTMIAGEEPEMCFRLKKKNWKIWRIDEEMTLHDAAMTSFRQFWLRNKRAGYAYAERWAMHSTKASPYCTRELISICAWTLAIPGLATACSIVSPLAAVFLLLAYPAMALRMCLRKLKKRNSVRRSIVFGVLTMIGKFPQFVGVAKFSLANSSGSRTTIIEYK
ncbi:glycosyltransferase family 2 protein [Microbulbifer agarilyticus]